jgi:error-prone DNA polymerase
LKAHPMSFLRAQFRHDGVAACNDLRKLPDGVHVSIAGVILVRQRPGTAKGVVFMTLEDETGVANTVVWPQVLERYRKVVMGARLVLIRGRIQRHEDIIHLVSEYLEDRSAWLQRLAEDTPLMPIAIANADEVLRPDRGSARGSLLGQESLLAANHTPPGSRPPAAVTRTHPRNARIIPKSRDFH